MIAALAVGLFLAPAVVVDRDAVDQSVKQVLENPDYSFCHDAEYPLRPSEVGWCPLVGDKSPRCPSLPAACKAGATEADPTFLGKTRQHKPGQAEEEPEDQSSSREIRLPDLGGLGRVLLWGMLIAGAGALIYIIAKAAMNRRRQEEPPPVEEPPPEGESPEAAARRALETDVDRLLARARAHAAAGRHDAAIDDAYAALLRRLEGGELIRVHPSRTNGDYLRDLAKLPELRSKVRAIARDVERVQFGTDAPSEERFTAVMERVVPIASRALSLAAMLLVSSLLLACGKHGVLNTHSRGPWDSSPSGTRAVFEVLRKNGLEPHWRVKPLAKLGDVLPTKLRKEGESGSGTTTWGPDVLVLLPGTMVSASDWTAVKAYAEHGGTVIATADLDQLSELGIRPRELMSNGALRLDPNVASDFGPLKLATPGTRFLHVDSGVPDPILHRGDELYAAELAESGGVIVVLGDGYLLENAALTVADNAVFLVTLLRKHGTRVEFTGDFTGSSPENPIQAVKRGKLAPLLLQLGLLLLLFFLLRGVAFGTPRDPKSETRRRFVEHVRALGLQYARARATRFAAAAYSGYTLDRLRERIQLGTRRGLSPLAEAIALRTGRHSGEVLRILVEAQSARETALDRDTPPDDLALIRDLSRLLKSIGGSR